MKEKKQFFVNLYDVFAFSLFSALISSLSPMFNAFLSINPFFPMFLAETWSQCV